MDQCLYKYIFLGLNKSRRYITSYVLPVVFVYHLSAVSRQENKEAGRPLTWAQRSTGCDR